MISFVEFSFFLIFYYFIHILFFTIKTSVYNFDNFRKPSFVLFWHGKMLPLVYTFRNMDVYVLVSLSRDGEIARRLLKLFGFNAIRGSSSKGGLKGLSEIIKYYKENKIISITPDGPRGPKGKIDEKMIKLLMRIGRIYCLEVKGKGFRLKTWDSFFIPMPFSKIDIYIREIKDINLVNDLMGEL